MPLLNNNAQINMDKTQCCFSGLNWLNLDSFLVSKKSVPESSCKINTYVEATGVQTGAEGEIKISNSKAMLLLQFFEAFLLEAVFCSNFEYFLIQSLLIKH